MPQPRRWRRKEERCKSCGGTPCVFTHPKNRHRKPTDHDVLVQALTVKIEPLDPTPPDTMPPEILPDTMPPDISPDAPAPPRGEKRGDGDPAPPRGERTEDGDRYAPVPNVDPGGRQRPEVIGTLCGRGRSRIRISDRRRHCSNRGRFRPASEDRRRSYRSNRDRFKKSNNYKTLVMGPVFPMKNETGQRTFVPVFYLM